MRFFKQIPVNSQTGICLYSNLYFKLRENHNVGMQLIKDIDSRFLLKYIFFFLCFTSSAQQWVPDFKHFTPRDGLPSSEVYQITSDPQNNLWFSTDRGAVRYDGYTFRTYDNKDSLPDNSVIKLYKDQQDRIWFISYNCLLSYFKDGKIYPYKFNNIIRSNLSNTIITSLYADQSDNIHLNSIEGAYYTITAAGKLIINENHDPNSLFTINATRDSSVTTYYQKGQDNSVTKLQVETLRDTFSIVINEPISYHHFATSKLRNNDLVFYCERFLIRIRPSGAYEVKKMKSPILNVFEDENNSIWIGTYHDGVYVSDSSLNVTSHYLRDLSVSHIYNDFEGGTWLSTLENGLFYLASKNSSSFEISGKLLHEKITAISNGSGSELYFTTSNGILIKYNLTRQSIDNIDLKKHFNSSIEYINSIYYNKSAREIMLGGIIKFGINSGEIYTAEWMNNRLFVLPSLSMLVPHSNGNILGSTSEYVFSFNSRKKSQHFLNENKLKSNALLEDSQGRLFSGSWNVLYLLKNSKFVPVDTTAGLLGSRITALNELKNNFIAIGTRSNGIFIYSDRNIKNIVTSDGLTSDNINCIAVEDSIIWAGTNKGISRITITDYFPFTYTIDRYRINNGLVSDEINGLAINEAGVFAATNEGLNFINKEQVSNKIIPLPLYITTVRINDHDTTLAPTYSLNHKQNNVDISFTGLSFRNSKNIIYRYRLLGLDTTWRTTLNRDVRFSGLNSGYYIFQLLASYENDSNAPVELYFSIAPSFYKTDFFRILAALCMMMIIIGVANARIKTIQNKSDERNALNKKFSELNLNALRSQMNPHFTFNVLNSIKYYIAKKDPESAQFYISKFSKLIRLILDQSRTEYITLNEEIEMLKLYMELEELRFENKFKYSITVGEKLNPEEIDIPGMLIQPFVENSIKHGIRYKKGEAKVEVDFTSSDSVLICTITDNGIGRAEAAKLKPADAEHKSMGTTIVNERIEALSILFKGKLRNYTIDLKDEQGNPIGTCVTIEIPFKKTMV